MALVWTDEARKQLVLRAPEGAASPKRVPVGAAWGSLRRALVSTRYDPAGVAFELGRREASPPFDAWMERAEEIARSATMPKFDDANVAAVFAAIMGEFLDHALVTSIYPQKCGLPFAFEVAIRLANVEVSRAGASRALYAHARTTPIEPDLSWREALLAAPAEARAECMKVAERLWDEATLGQKTLIAYTLFEREDWAREICRAWINAGDFPAQALYAVVRDEDLALALVERRTQARSLLELVETFGESSLPMLAAVASAPRDGDARWVAEALAQIDDAEAAKALAPLVKWAPARPYVRDYFVRHPHRADALAPVALDKRQAAAVAKDVLAGARRAEGARTNGASEASLAELPPLFSKPPWRETRRPKKPARSLALEPIDQRTTIAWQTGERERALAVERRFTQGKREATPETIAAHARVIKRRRPAGFFVHGNDQRLPDASVLAAWNAGVLTWGPTSLEKLQYALAKFGDAAISGLVKFVETLEREESDMSFLLRVGSPRLALPMAKLRRTRWATLGWQWLRRHDAIAALGLVPAAFADDTRDDAEGALLQLAAAGTDVVAIGARYGDEAKSAIEELLTYDPLHDAPKRAPKLGGSWRPETLTRPVTTAGKVLPLAAMQTLGEMLAFSPLDAPYAGIAVVKSLCTPRSLAELAWDAARSWEHAGRKRRDRWMLGALVHFADDEVVRRITRGLRVDFAIDALERIGTDAALMELATIAGRARESGDKKLAARAEAILDRAASLRGVDKDELEEDLAPAKALEPDGTVSLDFGPRKLRVGFDEHLQPFVINDGGERVRALMPARAGDDPERVERAKELWRDLKEDVAVLAARRIAGLRRAMTNGRRWTAARFRRVWIDNGLMKHLAREIVWIAHEGAVATPFRVAEDGSLSTSRDDAFTLAEGATVSVLHPLRTPRDELERWRALFADYRIVQPFPQIERAPLPAGDRMPWPYPVGSVNDFSTRLVERGFVRAGGRYGHVVLRRELLGVGAIVVEMEGTPNEPAKNVQLLLVGDGLDRVEVADILDDVQWSMPVSSRP